MESATAARVYTGNGAYCFSNGLHMCLVAQGEGDTPATSFIECLTTLPFGCAYRRLDAGALFFPSSPLRDPEAGLELAIETLGWSCELHLDGSFADAWELLERALDRGPVLIGPLDMAHLTYNPHHELIGDADHYVVGLSRDDTAVSVHDPAGYPWAVLPVADLERAWRAENPSCAYKRGPYTLRFGFRRKHRPSLAEMRQRAVAELRKGLSESPDGPVEYGNAPALTRLATDLREGKDKGLRGMLTYFSLPLAARRCTDGAVFLEEVGLKGAASVQLRIARTYGRAASHAATGRWPEVAEAVDALAADYRELELALDSGLQNT